MDPKLITPILIAALMVWGVVRRLRRTFGRQPVHSGRLWLRIGLLTLAGGLVVATSATRGAESFEALAAGLACGAALGYPACAIRASKSPRRGASTRPTPTLAWR
jgi:hypothetical protein